MQIHSENFQTLVKDERIKKKRQKFGTKYESTIVSGKAIEVFNDEKQRALEGLVEKYSSEFIESGAKYIDALTHKTRVFKIVVANISGKSRRK